MPENRESSLPVSDVSPFGGTGKVVTSFAATVYAAAMALMTDGRIVVGGSIVSGANQHFAVARYLADGSLDPTFGSGGTVITPVGSGYATLLDLAVQPDGKIVAVGTSAGETSEIAVLRYEEDGTLDPTFGGTGKVITSVRGKADHGNAVALQPDGKVVVVGSSADPMASSFLVDFAVVRYESDGDLDTSFGGTGKVTTSIGEEDFAYSVALQADGRIVAAGSTSSGGPGPDSKAFALVRFDADGDLDATFGDAGVVATAIVPDTGQTNIDVASAVAVQPDGRIVAAGFTYAPDDPTPEQADIDIALVRYNADGTVDTTLGGTGRIVTAFSSGPNSAKDVALQSDGRIVVVGSAEGATPGVASFAIARYRPATGCPAMRATTCIEGWNAASLKVQENPEKTRKVIARLLAGPPLARTDFGDPLLSAGTAYAVCVYDDADRLAGKLEVDRAGDACGTSDCWKPLGPSGYVYRDKASAADGVRSATLLATMSGESKVLIRATSRVPEHLVELPIGIASGLVNTSHATLQLFGSDAPECFSATLTRVLRSDPDRFEAKQ